MKKVHIEPSAAEPAKAIQDAMLKAVAEHQRNRKQEDDVTLVVVKSML